MTTDRPIRRPLNKTFTSYKITSFYLLIHRSTHKYSILSVLCHSTLFKTHFPCNYHCPFHVASACLRFRNMGKSSQVRCLAQPSVSVPVYIPCTLGAALKRDRSTLAMCQEEGRSRARSTACQSVGGSDDAAKHSIHTNTMYFT